MIAKFRAWVAEDPITLYRRSSILCAVSALSALAMMTVGASKGLILVPIAVVGICAVLIHQSAEARESSALGKDDER